MGTPLPFLNFSLKRVLVAEPDNLIRARLKIVYVTLILWLIKILLIVPVNYQTLVSHQLWRAGFVFLLFAGLAKLLLYKPQTLGLISHIIVLSGVAAVWSALFIFSQNITLVTIQIMFMVLFVGYYLVDRRYAIFYGVAAVFPVVFHLYFSHTRILHLDVIPADLPSPAFEIVVTMNFVTMVLINYLFYMAFRDNVREKEELNRQLEAKIAETRALADSRSLFLSTMSHELRTPLNAVIGMASLIKETAVPEQHENLDILEFSATSLLTLVNDILDYNKSENDKIVLEAIPVSLPALLHKICYGMQQKAAEKGINLIVDVDERLNDQQVITDPTRLTQVIYNLAGNAIKFTKHGQVTVKARVTTEDIDNIGVAFLVSDTGIGIPADKLDEIFEPFIQASADTTRHYGGTGLGLAIVKRLLLLFGSEIKVSSEFGKGSEFSFSAVFATYKAAAHITLPGTINNSLDGLNLLIAEDNNVNSLLLIKLLSRWGVKATIALNGQEVIDKLLNANFDAILMDLHMPVMDGYQATAYIRSLDDPIKANVPIIALTASVSHNIYEKIREAGMDDYLSKPFQSAALYQKLELLKITKAGRTVA